MGYSEYKEKLKGKCYTCKHWQSYADRYEDDLEPNDLGVCDNGLRNGFEEKFPTVPKTEQMAHDDSCLLYETNDYT
jgi:hypothetical protein